MKNKVWKVLLLTMVILAANEIQVFAWGGRPNRPEDFGKGKMLERISRQLNLSAEQKEKIKVGIESRKGEMDKNHARNQEIMENMKKELRRERPDRTQVHRYVDELNKFSGQMQHRRIDDILDLKEILTPAQNKKFNEMFEKPRRFDFGKERRPGPKR